MLNLPLAFFGPLSGWEAFLIIFVALLFFGAKKIPELARGVGKGIREFKDATSGINRELEDGMKDDSKK